MRKTTTGSAAASIPNEMIAQIMEHAAARQGQLAQGIEYEHLVQAAAEAGIEERHVAAALAELLAEFRGGDSAPNRRRRASGVLRFAFGRLCVGLGVAVVVTWQSIHGVPAELLIHLGALASIWMGVRLEHGTKQEN